MRHQSRALLGMLAVVVSFVWLAPVPVTGQASSAAAKTAPTGTPARTAWGDPDLQGVWDYDVSTPLLRPKELAGKEFLTEAEAAAFQKALEAGARERDYSANPAPLDTGTYNTFWVENGTAGFAKTRRTSLIIDPKDGRMPPLTPEAQKRFRAEVEARRGLEKNDVPPGGWIDDLGGGKAGGATEAGLRCLVGINASPPIVPCCYNNHIQVFQTPGTVAILSEMIHTPRIIPVDGRAPLNPELRLWSGASRGRWEGQTLVVETTNFHPDNSAILRFRGHAIVPNLRNLHPTLSANMHLVERFTRADAGTLLYEFTIEDPTVWTRPWTAQIPMVKTQDKMYEYACHEGNYGLYNILAGARAEEKTGSPGDEARYRQNRPIQEEELKRLLTNDY